MTHMPGFFFRHNTTPDMVDVTDEHPCFTQQQIDRCRGVGMYLVSKYDTARLIPELADMVDVTPTSPPVDWTPGDVQTAILEARARYDKAGHDNDIVAAEAALKVWRKLAFRHGDEKVEK